MMDTDVGHGGTENTENVFVKRDQASTMQSGILNNMLRVLRASVANVRNKQQRS